METIHVILDKKLLQATDRAAPRNKQNRSALVREALRSKGTVLAVSLAPLAPFAPSTVLGLLEKKREQRKSLPILQVIHGSNLCR